MPERKTIDNETKYKGLLQIWTEAYEESIVLPNPGSPKKRIDEACYRAVQKWTKILEDHEVLFPEDTASPQCDTVEQSIRHHIRNLIYGGTWTDKEETQPKITRLYHSNYDCINNSDHVWMVEIPVCEYKKACEWGLKERRFNLQDGEFRCQRVGCFVGAVRKYLNVTNQDNVNPEEVDFFMFKVHTTDGGGCQGFIYVNRGTICERLQNCVNNI
jgi:hypothetical protein